MTIEEKFRPFIGCHTFIDMKNGFLNIDSHGKALVLSSHGGQSAHGMLTGVRRMGRKKVLVVTYDGFNSFVYDPKFTKVI
ncbi:hypothetical protein A2Z56_02515 [Candidatus Kaiserbacteria bacterium RIFCSPHIGHO2_12_45_16]|nr:MAG: hypothetical protein A2Z56_02515 [Candidatus Kaiserbacteria bacterium RIFCSPHIGHO2_12_45_16]